MTEAQRAPGTRPAILAAAVLLPVAIYVILSAVHIGDPFTNDETWEFQASRTLLWTGVPKGLTGEVNDMHPYAYYYLVAGAFQLFGISPVSARIIGIASACLTYLVLLRWIRVLRGAIGPWTCILLGFLYLLSPLVVQGSLVITADTGVHQLVLALFLLYVLQRHPFRAVDLPVLAALFALTLAVKIVNPCLVMASIVLFFVWKRDWRQAAAAAAVGAGGLLLFLSFWIVWCRFLDVRFWGIFDYLWMVFCSRNPAPSPLGRAAALARGGLVLVIWLGIPYAILVLGSFLRFGRQRGPAGRSHPLLGLLVTTGAVLLAGHVLVSGIPMGFPRYHYSLLPICAVLVTLFVEERREEIGRAWRPGIALAGIAAAWILLVVGDPLCIINYELKLAILRLPDLPPHSFAWIAGMLSLLVLPLAAVWALPRLWKSAVPARGWLLFLTLGTSAAMAVIQAKADYSTHYSYGENGTKRMLAYCSSRLEKGKRVLSTMDVVYYLVDAGYIEDWRWSEPETLRARIQDPETQFVVMGVNHNTVEQIRSMTAGPEYRALFREKGYTPRSIGSYLLWERGD